MAYIILPPDAAVTHKRAIKWVWRILAVGGAIALGPVVWFSVWRWNLRQEINARVAAIRVKGLPLNWDDLAKWPSQVADTENAALLYTNAIGHLDPAGIGREPDLPRRAELLSDETKAKITAAIKKDRAALDIAYSAEKLHKSRYPVHYEDGPGAPLSHLWGLRRIAYFWIARRY